LLSAGIYKYAGIVLPANLDKFFRDFSGYKYNGMRLGTGEFSDSLALDNITGYSLSIIDFFKKQHRVTLNLKLKVPISPIF